MFKNSFDRIFFSFFPVPNFFAAPSFGLDISDESLKFVQLTNASTHIKLGKYGERKIPSGIIESGKIKDPEKMVEVLTALRKQVGIKNVRVSLPEEQVYLFRLQLLKDGLVNIRESIELSLEEHIPISAVDSIFDYEVVTEDEQKLELQVAAIPKNVIEEYLALFKNSSIEVKSFELEAQAISRSIIKKGDLETYMIVDFGQTRTGIFIVSKGLVTFTSTLDVGGITLNNMIAKNFKITFEEAKKMKEQYGLQRNAGNKEIFSVLLNSVSVLRDEIVKHFMYWHTHKDDEGNNNPPIKKIILCGGDANLIGLSDYLSVSIKTPVELSNSWVNIVNTKEYIPAINFKQALSYATALGLALGDFEIGRAHV